MKLHIGPSPTFQTTDTVPPRLMYYVAADPLWRNQF